MDRALQKMFEQRSELCRVPSHKNGRPDSKLNSILKLIDTFRPVLVENIELGERLISKTKTILANTPLNSMKLDDGYIDAQQEYLDELNFEILTQTVNNINKAGYEILTMNLRQGSSYDFAQSKLHVRNVFMYLCAAWSSSAVINRSFKNMIVDLNNCLVGNPYVSPNVHHQQ